MRQLLDKLYTDPFFAHFIEALSSPSLLFEGLWDSPKGLLLATTLFQKKRPLVVIIEGDAKDRLFEDLRYFAPERVIDFPAWEVLLGEDVTPSPDIMGERLAALMHLSRVSDPPIILTPLSSLLQKVPSPKEVKTTFDTLHTSQEIAYEWVTELLNELGYQRVKLIEDKGQYALRGGIIDLYPPTSMTPYRIEFVGDEIEEIRTFDPMTQKSHETVDHLTFGHASEYDLIHKSEHLVSLLDYLSEPILVFDGLVAIEDRYAGLKQMMQSTPSYFVDFHSLLSPTYQRLLFSDVAIESLSPNVQKKGDHLSFDIFDTTLSAQRMATPFLTLDTYYESEDIAEGIAHHDLQTTTYFITQSNKEKEKLCERIDPLPKDSHFLPGYLSSGFALASLQLACVPYTELTHRYKVRRKKWRTSYHTPASEFHAINNGDLVVHFHNGIGRYLGVEKKQNHLGQMTEFLIIEYAGGSKLYVPASQSHLVSRYIGAHEEIPELHKLGASNWQKQKVRAQKAIIGYAKELIELQAQRELAGGIVYPEDSEEMKLFEEAFEYTETADQFAAITDIKRDMLSDKPLDRLICGDVGYGKTEVAMRAVFKAIADGQKQVAVLVPTTVLAMQHYDSFTARMEDFGVNIAVASRFQTPKQTKEILHKAAEGKLDILIGTHRLLSKDVHFKNLGLLIIDEEQRFGVRSKEKLKQLKANVDCLTLTATPIPRTLYFSLIGARPMSVISSPPHDRLPIKTIIAERDDDVIKNALLRELSRSGQAYLIHNRVETIYKVAEETQKLVPTAKIGIVHGQMSSDAIDEVFHAFKKGSLNVLIATTIIENGIDIPNANTILVDRADRFGISNLYQIRGRVGRWNKSAYAYFLIPKDRSLSEPSRKRLHALVEASGFGGGIKLAMRDLEIRGAGDILGVQQSGHITTIGFHLYCKLLKRAVNAMKKKEQASFIETRMEFSFDAKLSESYIHDSTLRLEIYHRLGDASTFEEVDEIFDELRDRFGKPPESAVWLRYMSRIRVFCSRHNFTLVKLQPQSAHVERTWGEKTETYKFLIAQFKDPATLEALFIHRLCQKFSLPPPPFST